MASDTTGPGGEAVGCWLCGACRTELCSVTVFWWVRRCLERGAGASESALAVWRLCLKGWRSLKSADDAQAAVLSSPNALWSAGLAGCGAAERDAIDGACRAAPPALARQPSCRHRLWAVDD